MLIQITVRVPTDFEWAQHPPGVLTVSGAGYSGEVDE
jgi:hypothetical protein